MSSPLALHQRFPGTRALAHVALGCWPTPVRAAPELARALSLASLFIKHDDLSGLAYGGNKVRKLEFLLGQALAEKRRSLITFGATGSNHVRATAVYGAQLGLRVHAVLTPQPETSYSAANLQADRDAGAIIHMVDSYGVALSRGTELREQLTREEGIEPAVIPFGGSDGRGTLGFVNAAFELAGQIADGLLPASDCIYLPYGSTGTGAGLALGLAAAGLRARVIGVRVVPAEATNPVRTARIMNEAAALLREADGNFPSVSATDAALTIREGFLGEGYAVPTPESQAAVALAATHGLHLETTYTGRALAALTADASTLSGQTVLFWNTYNSR
jgi:1-aminocyclopropane-1-carboxylate deaminase/D-cysteine desulfhydrase-like pyridoxal-dependent ACC family enzyme